MKTLMLILLLSVFSTMAAFPQTNGQIQLIKRHYYLNDKQLNNTELKGLLKSNSESAKAYSNSQNYTIGGIVLIVGGVTYMIATTAFAKSSTENHLPGIDPDADKKAKNALTGGGIALVGCVGLLLANSQMKKSISIYNSKHTTGYNGTIKLDLGFTRNGFGMVCKF
jgi:hypothetical protein